MSGAPARRAMIAKIHVAKKQLALEDGDYRAILERVAGKASSAECSDAQLERVLGEFARLGFSQVPGPRLSKDRPWVRKIFAIWHDLRPLLDGASDETLRGFVRRQTKSLKNPEGVGDPKWLDAKEATKVIHGLEGWLGRVRAKESADV